MNINFCLRKKKRFVLKFGYKLVMIVNVGKNYDLLTCFHFFCEHDYFLPKYSTTIRISEFPIMKCKKQ